MNDRELLELAEKAAGYDGLGSWDERVNAMWDGEGWHWNPLTDDGDALRLAVKLQFEIDIGFKSIATSFGSVAIRHMTGIKILEAFKNDPYAATRRAIVRAAAEIGRNMT